MQHVRPPVANVARVDISDRSTSTTAPSAPIAPADPSAPHCQRGIQHPQDTLSTVQKPAPPIEKPTPSPSSHRIPGPGNSHIRSSVSFVRSRFDERAARERIENMTDGASSMLYVWPLDGLMKLLPTTWGTRTRDPTPQPKEVENTPQPSDVKDASENDPKSLQEEDMMDNKSPPPYHPSTDQNLDAKYDNKITQSPFGDPKG